MSSHSEPSLPLAELLAAREQFLGFLQRRVGNRETAEDILQAAYLRALDKQDQLQDDERVTAWFYRLLRNAIIDHWRRRGTASRAVEALAAELGGEAMAPTEFEEQICRCFTLLLPTLGKDQAHILEQVDLGGMRPVEFAAAEGISANNAMVRLHRARRALRERLLQTCSVCAEHGCLDCTCGAGPESTV